MSLGHTACARPCRRHRSRPEHPLIMPLLRALPWRAGSRGGSRMDCDGQINPVDSGIVQSLFGTCEAPRDVCSQDERGCVKWWRSCDPLAGTGDRKWFNVRGQVNRRGRVMAGRRRPFRRPPRRLASSFRPYQHPCARASCGPVPDPSSSLRWACRACRTCRPARVVHRW